MFSRNAIWSVVRNKQTQLVENTEKKHNHQKVIDFPVRLCYTKHVGRPVGRPLLLIFIHFVKLLRHFAGIQLLEKKALHTGQLEDQVLRRHIMLLQILQTGSFQILRIVQTVNLVDTYFIDGITVT